MVKSVPFKLDLPPTIGQVSGYDFKKTQLAWQQSPQWHVLILTFYSGEITVNGSAQRFNEGSAIVVTPGSLANIRRDDCPKNGHFFLHFTAHPEATHLVSLPTISDFAPYLPAFDNLLAMAFDRFLFTKCAAQSVVWTLLWSLSTEPNASAENPSLAKVRDFVEQNLAKDFSVADLARVAGISHNHLIRIMREELGVTPQQYVRQKRLETACQLLVSSPEPIKSIAHSVGISDLQRFNKLVRDAFGASPRELRSQKLVKTSFRDTR